MKSITLNPGAQYDFVHDGARGAGYIGGLGSGKTFAGMAKGLAMSQQPAVGFMGPRGAIAAASYPVLRTIILPAFFELMDGTGLWKTGSQGTSYNKSEWTARLKAACRCADRVKCKHEALIHFVSLDDPDWIRGVELSWFFIDEGRNVGIDAWRILWGRLRQRGYKHQGWVCSTPNGFDWMYHKFHPKGRDRVRGSHWFTAATFENRDHLPSEYIPELLAEYKGRLARQEVYGEFVGAVDGAVFFEWDQAHHVMPIEFTPDLPLYSAWDFGMGALGVVDYLQLEWLEEENDGVAVLVPKVYCLGGLESANRTSKEWAAVHTDYCLDTFGRLPLLNVCDPAGRQRNLSTGTSIIEDLHAYGVKLAPAPKKPIDYGIRVINNLLAADRFVVNEADERLWGAFASHKWNLLPDGTRVGTQPVHDWTSHFVDPVRYFVATLLGHAAKRTTPEPQRDYARDTIGHVVKQLTAPREGWLGGPEEPHIDWTPGIVGESRTGAPIVARPRS